MSKEYKDVVLIESQVTTRDFYGRLLLGFYLALDDFKVFVGRNGVVQRLAYSGNNGIFIADNFSAAAEKRFAKLKGRGFDIYSFCEESTGTAFDELYVRRRISEVSVAMCELIFATHSHHRNLISQKVNDEEKLIVTGLPRFDLLNESYRKLYKNQQDIIRRDYKKFVLIPSSGSSLTQKGVQDYLEKNKKRGIVKDGDDHLFVDYFGHRTEAQTRFIDDLLELAKNHREINFVIRPKYNETKEQIQRQLNLELGENVHFDSRFSVHPWILSADLVIQDNCTTGVESFMADTPSVLYSPLNHSEYYAKASKALSYFITDKLELSKFLSQEEYSLPEIDSNTQLKFLPNKFDNSCRKVADLIQRRNVNKLKGSVNEQNVSLKEAIKTLYYKYSFEFKNYGGRGGNIKFSEAKNVIGFLNEYYKTELNGSVIEVSWIGKELLRIVKVR